MSTHWSSDCHLHSAPHDPDIRLRPEWTQQILFCKFWGFSESAPWAVDFSFFREVEGIQAKDLQFAPVCWLDLAKGLCLHSTIPIFTTEPPHPRLIMDHGHIIQLLFWCSSTVSSRRWTSWAVTGSRQQVAANHHSAFDVTVRFWYQKEGLQIKAYPDICCLILMKYSTLSGENYQVWNKNDLATFKMYCKSPEINMQTRRIAKDWTKTRTSSLKRENRSGNSLH